jgi:radical SAM superfamily enzyme YgiQ (UPF0313 family)
MSDRRALLIACYELGHQPVSVAWPLAALRQAGHTAAVLDLAVERFEPVLARAATFVAISVPMHTALRLGVQAAARVRTANPTAHICFFGLYAWLNEDYLLDGLADSVVAGEAEAALVALFEALGEARPPESLPGVSTRAARAQPALRRLPLPVPDRSDLPPLDKYAAYVEDGTAKAAGYVEASRGCLHTCTHCPIVPVYGGRFFAVPAEVVLADVRQQVAAGAGHITFGDPDFLNGPGHALRLARALHAEFPGVTFDFTAKVEHILQHRALFSELAALGCTFITSAIESVSESVLARLAKGHNAADIDTALAILDDAGIALQPTLVAFTPWTTLDDYLAQLEFIRTRGLEAHIAPVQLSIRLLLPPRSPLLAAPDAAEWLGELDPAAFSYRWRHPDPRMDTLYVLVAERVAAGEADGEPAAATHSALRALAYAAAGHAAPEWALNDKPGARRPPPRLTENWFC